MLDIVDDARLEAHAKGCDIDLGGDSTCVVNGDVQMLHRALENIVRNALRHSPAGAAVNIELHAREAQARIVVTDRGMGVGADELESIFEPFVRAATSAHNDGYGLGLAITRRVVEAHGGSVAAANRTEGGLCVSVLLPCAGASG